MPKPKKTKADAKSKKPLPELKTPRDVFLAGAESLRLLFSGEPGATELADELCQAGNKRLKELEEGK